MKKRPAVFLFLILLVFIPVFALRAQTSPASSPSDPNMTSSQFDMSGFPLWARDLRRAEIVAFGSFPFMYFFANFGFDAYRSAVNGWDTRYAPWPFTGEGAIGQTQDEKVNILWIAAGSAALVSLIDYGIVRYKRSREARELRNLPPGTPIIIRKPLSGENGGGETPETREASDGGPPPESSSPANTGTELP